MVGELSRRQILIGAAAAASAPYLVDLGTKQASAQGSVRVRREVHGLVASDGTLAPDLVIYMEAIAKTKKTSPMLWDIVTNFHDAFCDGLTGGGQSAGNKEVHGSWRFIMWHRAYLATYERILQEHSDKTISLPYWNWFKSDALPKAFTIGVLDHPGRMLGADPLNGIPARPIDDGDRSFDSSGEASNYDTSAAFGFTPGASFFGQVFATGENRRGRPEYGGHGGIHIWVGGNMSDLDFSSRDPCFYSHHANVDRMLELWKANTAPVDWLTNAPNVWKDQIFEFAFSNDRIYRYRAADMIDTSKIVDVDGVELGFVYDDVPETQIAASDTSLIAFSQSVTTENAFTQIEMRVTPPSQSFSLGALEVTGGRGATSAFEISDAARSVTQKFIGTPQGEGVNTLQNFSFSRTKPPSARLVLRNVVLPGKNSQVNFFINVENPGSAAIKDGKRYLGTINTIPSGEGDIVYKELSFKASDQILEAIQSDNKIFVSSFTRYLGKDDKVQISEVELVIE